MRLIRSNLQYLTAPDTFLWATGIEDTFITAPWPKTGRTLDEYELTGHYEHWREDLQLMHDLGVKTARYGVPWHRIQPHPNKWDWQWPDQTLSRMLELGVEPIVDLVHYGLPSWIEGAYTNPDFPKYMADYAARLADRFKGQLFAYTPLNEPRITAWYCGKLGWWPPFLRGWCGFLQVMNGVAQGIVETVQALESVDPDILPVHVDATDLYQSSDPSLAPEVERRQEIVFLALDLVSGRVVPGHKLYSWLLKNGLTEKQLAWFQEHKVDLPFIGINLYPMFSEKVLVRRKEGSLRIKMPYGGGDIIDRLADLYFNRYSAPIFISETASVGSLKKREQWLGDSVQATRRVRERGIPLVGYTWWPMFSLVTWAYRQGTNPPEYYLQNFGLWDLVPQANGDLRRVRTPLVDQYRALADAGAQAAGYLQAQKSTLERSTHV